LKARGINVRIVGTSKPFRVRVGQFETRAAANAAAKQLKAKRVSASVTDIEPEEQ
jgi:cell division protein FtsN